MHVEAKGVGRDFKGAGSQEVKRTPTGASDRGVGGEESSIRSSAATSDPEPKGRTRKSDFALWATQLASGRCGL